MSLFDNEVYVDGGNPVDTGGGFSALLLAILAGSINTLIQAISELVKLFNNLISLLKRLFVALGKFLDHIWKTYVKEAIHWFGVHIHMLQQWLKRTIGPIIARLEKIKKWYDEHILKQQLRLLQQIQMIRRFLGILRLFHVKWAAKLDGSLADLQNRVEQSISIVRGTLNQIINTLAIAFDPTMLITRNLLGASLLSNLGAIKRIFGFGDNRILSTSEQATIQHDHTLYFESTVKAHINTLATTGPTADDKSLRTAFRQALAEVTNTTLPLQAP
jgi:hypothetical protein